MFDGTDKTVPTDLQDKSVVDEIEEVNEGEVRFKLCDSYPALKSTLQRSYREHDFKTFEAKRQTKP